MTPKDAFLAAFSLHPAGVAVVTALLPDGTPVGFTATSLASFSAEPPRATINIATHASSYPALAVGSTILLHFLSEEQVGIARIMAGDHEHRFDGDHWSARADGLPAIHDVRAALTARVEAITVLGDNATVIVEIVDGSTRDACAPLVYVERRFHSVGDILPG